MGNSSAFGDSRHESTKAARRPDRRYRINSLSDLTHDVCRLLLIDLCVDLCDGGARMWACNNSDDLSACYFPPGKTACARDVAGIAGHGRFSDAASRALVEPVRKRGPVDSTMSLEHALRRRGELGPPIAPEPPDPVASVRLAPPLWSGVDLPAERCR